MLDMNKITNDFKVYNNSKRNYRFYNKVTHDFYMENMIEINDHLDTYYDLVANKKSTDELFLNHPNLRTYLTLQFVVEYFDKKTKEYSISSELENLGKCVLIDEDNVHILVDIDHDKEFILFGADEKLLKYITIALSKKNLFIGDIKRSELSLVKVINFEIEHDDKLKTDTNKAKCNRINRDLVKARYLDNSFYVDVKVNNNIPTDITEELKKLLVLYKNNEITKEEYLNNIYYLLIIESQNPEKIYDFAPDDFKEYVINAYIKLSSFGNDIHLRTTSEIINNLVLKRKKEANN